MTRSTLTTRGVEVELQDDSTYCISTFSGSSDTVIDHDDLSSIQVQASTDLENTTQKDNFNSSGASTIIKDLKTLPQTSCSPKGKHSKYGRKQGGKWDEEKGVLNKDRKSKPKISATQKYTSGVGVKQEHGLEDQVNVKKRQYPQKYQTICVKSKNAEKSGNNADTCIGRIWSNRCAKITIIIGLCSILAIFIGGWLIKKVYSIPGEFYLMNECFNYIFNKF